MGKTKTVTPVLVIGRITGGTVSQFGTPSLRRRELIEGTRKAFATTPAGISDVLNSAPTSQSLAKNVSILPSLGLSTVNLTSSAGIKSARVSS